MKSRFIFILAFCCVFSSPLSADLADARDARARGDLQAAAREYSRLAEAGNAVAQAHLGYMYYTGEGVEQDYARAVEWYRKAATQGNADAQYNLAVAYAFGEGVEQDNQQAVEWYRQAADQGHAVAQYSLGLSYTYGEGVEQDYDEAQRWFEMAAGQDYAAARDALERLRQALAKSNEEQIESTPRETAPETSETVTSGSAGKASTILDMNGIEPVLPRTQQQPGEELLATQAALTAGDKESVTGADADTEAQDSSTAANTETPPDTDEAVPNAAGEEDRKESFLKRLFGSGVGDEKSSGEEVTAAIEPQEEDTVKEPPEETPESTDDTMARANTGEEKEGFFGRLFSESDSGEPAKDESVRQSRTYDPALYEQGMAALNNGDYASAANAFREGANQGDPRAQYRLGSLYYQGLGVSQNYSQALRWHELAAEAGNADAQYSLGNMYFMGEGVEQSDARAGYWYEKAADQGHASARHNLSNLKRIMKIADSPPKAIKGEKQEMAAEAEEAGEEKRGFFKRLFGREEKSSDTIDKESIAGDREAGTGKVQSGSASRKQTEGSVPDAAVENYRKGMAYAFGDGVEKDQGKAFKYFKRAAEAGVAPAQYQLGVAYTQGEGTDQDAEQALYWYRQAAVQGHTVAQRNLGLMYMEGDGVEQDKIRALAWYTILAEGGNAMDVRRRDNLIRELSPEQIEESHYLKTALQSEMVTARQ